MLIERLKEFATAGLVERHVYPETLVRVEYGLTAKGLELKPVMDQVQNWADRWFKDTEMTDA